MDKMEVSAEANRLYRRAPYGSKTFQYAHIMGFLEHNFKLCFGVILISIIMATPAECRGNSTQTLRVPGKSLDTWKQTELQLPDFVFVAVQKHLLPGNLYHSQLAENEFDCDPFHLMALLNKDDGPSELSSGVDVLDEGLRIIDSGSYIVFFSVHMKVHFPNSEEPLEKECNTHYVFRQSRGHRGILLEIPNIARGNCPTERTVYKKGKFDLKSGDIIFVCLCPQVVEHTPQTTYIGMHLASSIASMPEMQF